MIDVRCEMDFPKLKNTLLCRILVYVLVIGAFAVPVIIVALIDAIPSSVKGCLLAAFITVFSFYLILDFLHYIF